MRKEITTASFVGLILLALAFNFNEFFNAIASFFLVGLIPGTQIAVPSIVVLSISVVAISAMIARPLKKHIPQKYNSKLVLQDLFKSKTSV